MNIVLRTATLATLGGAIPLGLAVLSSALRLVPVHAPGLRGWNPARANRTACPPR